jgi:type IV pilus assembly protein PilE
MHSKYSDDFVALGFEQEILVTEGRAAHFRIEIIEAGFYGFLATATAVVDFDGDGQINVWEIDQDNHLVEKTPD